MRQVESLLKSLGLRHSIAIANVEDLLQTENRLSSNSISYSDEISAGAEAAASPSLQAETKAVPASGFFQNYQRYDAIISFSKQLAASDNRVTYQAIGRSTEGREIGLVKISSGGSNKPGIWIDGGMVVITILLRERAFLIVKKVQFL
jgi:murein tripeptide amidase MpaA